jgi:hypothetical protein
MTESQKPIPPRVPIIWLEKLLTGRKLGFMKADWLRKRLAIVF